MDRYSQGTTDIEALKKILESLRITKEYASDKNRTIELVSSEEMLTASTIAVYNETAQTVIPKSMVLDLGQFDSDQTNFEDWWRGI